MKNIREFFDVEMQATKQSAGVSFSRTNARPLDSTAVFESFDAASSYAKLSATAYPGQIVAAYDEASNSMAGYILDPSSGTGLTKFASGGSTEELLEKINAEIEARKANDKYLSGEITTIVGTTLPELSSQLTSDLSVTMTAAEGSGDILKTYTLKQGNNTIGAIDIPRDFLVKSASVKTCTTPDDPVAGYKAGDKYIDFVLNTKEGTVEDQHLYVLVSDLVDNYEGGSTTTIDVSIDKNTNIITASVKAGSISRALLSTDVTDELDNLSSAIDSNTAGIADNLSKINTVSSDLGDEIARATAKENAISTAIDTKVAELNAKDAELQQAIETEASTARAAENANSSAITAEETRAKNEEAILSGLIQAETTARTTADSTLQGNIDSLSVALDGKITTETTNRTAAVNALSERLGAAESTIASQGETIAEHGTTIAANTTAITTEETRAKAAEQELSGAIDGIRSGYATKQELQAEASQRKADDDTLSAAIDAITADYLKASDKTELEGKITAEQNRAKGIEAGLAATLNTVSSDYLKASDKTQLEGKIADEATQRKADDDTLSAAIDSITADYLKASDKTELEGKIAAEAEARENADTALETKLSVTVEKQGTAESGYLATYVVKQNGSQVGSKINIPKDFVVKNASVKTCAEKDKPVSGLNVGDKYIDLEINTVDQTESSTHIYLPIKDMVDAYAGATTTTVKVEIGSDNSISASILDGSVSYSKLSSDVTGKFADLETADTELRADISKLSTDLGDEIDRATAAEEANAAAIVAEAERANAAEQYLSGEIDSKVYVENGSSTYNQLSVIRISKEEYEAKVGSGSPLIGNALYIVDSNVIDAYGQQIKNVAAPTDLSDATNKEYVDNALTATAHTLSTDYNTKINAITSDTSIVKEIELNGMTFTVANNKATLNIDVISCGNAF